MLPIPRHSYRKSPAGQLWTARQALPANHPTQGRFKRRAHVSVTVQHAQILNETLSLIARLSSTSTAAASVAFASFPSCPSLSLGFLALLAPLPPRRRRLLRGASGIRTRSSKGIRPRDRKQQLPIIKATLFQKPRGVKNPWEILEEAKFVSSHLKLQLRARGGGAQPRSSQRPDAAGFPFSPWRILRRPLLH